MGGGELGESIYDILIYFKPPWCVFMAGFKKWSAGWNWEVSKISFRMASKMRRGT